MKTKRSHSKIGNYLAKMLEIQAIGKIKPGLHEIDVLHDDWCAIFKDGVCNCNPDIVEVIKAKS